MPIQDTEKKLEAFTDTIISAAICQADVITADLRAKQDALIKEAEASIADEAKRYEAAEIAEAKAEAERRISAKLNANKHALLEYREFCANEIYNQVQTKISEYTASEDYHQQLKKLLQEAIDTLGYGLSVEVFLRKEDMRFADELLASTSGVSIAFCEGEFSLGGIRVVCHSKGRRIDMSYDTALNDMVGHFSELAGLKVE